MDIESNIRLSEVPADYWHTAPMLSRDHPA